MESRIVERAPDNDEDLLQFAFFASLLPPRGLHDLHKRVLARLHAAAFRGSSVGARVGQTLERHVREVAFRNNSFGGQLYVMPPTFYHTVFDRGLIHQLPLCGVSCPMLGCGV